MKVIGYTDRTYLRETTIKDAESFYNLNSDPEVIKYTGDATFTSLAEARDFYGSYDHFNKYNRGRWAVIHKDTNEIMGWCGLKHHESTMNTDIGFRFFKKHWNKGYATETSHLCMHYAFRRLALEEVIARAAKKNVASLKVISKLGMTYQNDFEDHGNLAELYSISKYDYFLQGHNQNIQLY